jgi:exosortase
VTPNKSTLLENVKISLGLSSFLAIWGLLLFQLSITWETNEQYAHGFLVPFLCLFLLLKSDFSTDKPDGFWQEKTVLLSYLIGVPLLLLLFPIWVVRGANSDWRLINVALYLIVLILSILHLAFIYKQDVNIKKLLFPLLFFLVAIPWPLATDLQFTQWLQEKISSIIVDILLLLGHEAILQGTVIDVGIFGKVGIDQACSGINGLQASLVVSLFLGAYYSFPLLHRFLLLIGGIFIALFFNLNRAFCLSFIKVKGKGHYLDESLFSIGDYALPNLHDLVGFIETGFIFITILLLARLSKGGLFLTTLGTAPSNWRNLFCAPPLGLSITSLVVILGSVIGSEYHYTKKEKSMASMPHLNLNLEDEDILSSEQEISNQIQAQLHYEDARSVQWQDKFRSRWNPYGFLEINQRQEYWQAFEANWESGGACTAVLSTHTPESCLPLTGLTQVSPAPGQDPLLVPVKVDGEDVLFEAYEFTRNYRKLFVFRCFWPNKLTPGQPNVFPRGGYSFDGRINSALEGRRNVGGTMLALALANVDSPQTAINKLQALANQRLSFGNNEAQ